MSLELLLAHADDGQPVLPAGLPMEALHFPSKPEPLDLPERLWDASGDHDRLPRQRWGLVVPQGAQGQQLLARVRRLREHREAQQGGKPARVYCVPPGMDGASAANWKRTVFRDEAVSEPERPRYLLLLGDLDQVSLELQQELGTDAFVGRLTFPTDEGYDAYVDKVLRWEATEARAHRPRVLFYTAQDDSGATRQGREMLIEPGVSDCRSRRTDEGRPLVEVHDIIGRVGDPLGGLLARAAEPGPAVLFSLSHGAGAPREGWSSLAQQHARQGALVLPGGQLLTAADLAAKPFLPGGVWFCLACFSAGTPAPSSYTPWLRDLASTVPEAARILAGPLPRLGDRPFIAALPQAVLANREGPLAVIGHVDLAWSSGFNDHGRGMPSRFLGVIQALLESRRVGAAIHTLLRFFGEANSALAALYLREALEREAGKPCSVASQDKAELWVRRQDLASYVLLGDPAARLALRTEEAT
ncbi:hypothetical protein JY651_50455 [Pyxidicoccus parkwayensis]|uniref:Uncharacterized protein n=1 Tax=Pyxidicoccus parkwayensis TaxID=2813578 RepID=A0ABX7NXV4_9BACT|nr:hypothetical protein [Pyxidicoccus parkwaysis]QSQ23214.1 hypothetical protein JY651_50455 [Pyxidicoccus parkwaysis]